MVWLGWTGLAIFACGFLLGLRFLFHFALGSGQGYLQSLVLAALLLGSGFFLSTISLLADLISANRKLLLKTEKRLEDAIETAEHLSPAAAADLRRKTGQWR